MARFLQSKRLFLCLTLLFLTAMKQCQCLNPARGVKPSLIAQVKILPPLPYCRKAQVIVTLKDDRRLCLDPAFDQPKTINNDSSHCISKANMVEFWAFIKLQCNEVRATKN
uniref:Chemokine interleukin-8-like domain-containing protein n=1 Tax=Oryzias melastigma TaxID=30732 RepID=A0A3B3CAD3_ORYME